MIVAANPDIDSYSLGDLGPSMPFALEDPNAFGTGLVALQLNATTDAVVLNYTDPAGTPHTVSCDIVDAALGQVRRAWVAGDMPAIGAYIGQIVVTRSGDITFPRSYPRDKGRVRWNVFQPVGSVVAPTTNYVNDNASTLPIGTPVYQTSAGHADAAVGSDATHATVVGIAAAPIASSASGPVQSTGSIIASASEWTAVVTGAPSGGLTPNAAYYVDPATPGKLTSTPPAPPIASGKYSTFMGVAANANQLDLDIQTPVGIGAPLSLLPSIHFGAGQSNEVGEATASDLGGGWVQPDSNIQLFDQYALPPPGLAWLTFNGDLAPYAPTTPNFGSEVAVGKRLFANGLRPILGKLAQGTTTLAVSWDPTGTYPQASPNLFQQLVAYVLNLVAITGAPLQSFTWIQGESDAADNTMTASYGANLAAFFVALRAALGMPALPVVIVQLNSNMDLPTGNIATIQAAQAAWVSGDAHAALVVTNDLVSVINGVHYNAADQVTLGERIAAAIMTLIGASAPAVSRDSTSLKFLPATNAESTALLAGLPGAPANPLVLYNVPGLSGVDAMGVQNLTIGGGWTATVPNGWSKYAFTSADNNGNSISSSAGPFGDPYAASHLLRARLIITGTPGGNRDVMGFGGAAAYRGVQVTAAMKLGLYDLSTSTLTLGMATYSAGVAYDVFLQYDRTNRIFQLVTPLETIVAPFNLSTTTNLLFTLGMAVANAGPMQILHVEGRRGGTAEISAATMAGMMARSQTGIAA